MQFELNQSLLELAWRIPQRTLNDALLDRIHWNLDNIAYDVHEALMIRIARHLHNDLQEGMNAT